MFAWLAKDKEKERPKPLIVVGYVTVSIIGANAYHAVEPILLVKNES